MNNSIAGAAIPGVMQGVSAAHGAVHAGAAAVARAAAAGVAAGSKTVTGPVIGGGVAGVSVIGAGASAAAKLNDAITLLTIKSALTKASKSASSLSSVFSGANGNLAGSWANVSEFANTINKRVEELIKRFSDELQAFAAMTEQNEQEITSATNNANDLASNILAELGL